MKKNKNNSKLSFAIIIYIGSNLINGLIPFFFLKLLTDFLSPTAFGILDFYQLFIFLLIPIVGLNSSASLNRLYFEKELNYTKVFSNVLSITILFSFISLVIIHFAQDYLVENYHFQPKWVYFIILYLFINKISENLLITLQVKEKPLQYGLFRIFKTSLDVLCSIVLLYLLEDKLSARIEGQLLGVSIAGLIALYFLRKDKLLKIQWNNDYVKKILTYSLPLIPHAIGAFVINLSDRMLINYYCGMEQVGLYAVGYQIGMGVSMVQNSFNQAWVPWFFKQLNENKHHIKLRIVKMTYAYALFLFFICFALYLAAPLLFHWVINAEYSEAILFIPYVAIGFALNGLYKMMVNYLFYTKDTKMIGAGTIGVAILNILLNLWLIPQLGTIGAAIATTVSFGAQFIFFAIFATRKYKMPWLLQKNE